MKHRILGFDLARALAIFGMIIVNFKIAMNATRGNSTLLWFAGLFEGRASALFVILAGIGITLLSQKNIASANKDLINKSKQAIIKRGIILIIIGLSFTVIWEADILHFYGFYFLLAALFITSKDNILLILATISMLLFPILMIFFDYDKGWDWTTYSYLDFWTLEGMFRHISFNGFHPVFPWVAFLLYGMWLGRQDLAAKKVQRKLIITSLILIIIIESVMYYLRLNISEFSDLGLTKEELYLLFSTTIIPPLPSYVISAGSVATIVIVLSIIISNYFKENKLVSWLVKTGQVSLSLYIAHVIIGMGLLELFLGLEHREIEFSLAYSALFCILSIFFSVLWLKHFKRGPLEMVFKKFTNS